MPITSDRAERIELAAAAAAAADVASLDAGALAGRTEQELVRDCLRDVHVLWHLLGETVSAVALAQHDAHPTTTSSVPPRRWAAVADDLTAARRSVEDLLHAIDPARADDIVRAATALGSATAAPAD